MHEISTTGDGRVVDRGRMDETAIQFIQDRGNAWDSLAGNRVQVRSEVVPW